MSIFSVMALFFLVSSLLVPNVCQSLLAYNHDNRSDERQGHIIEVINGSNVSLVCPVAEFRNVTWLRDFSLEIATCRGFVCEIYPDNKNGNAVAQRNASMSSLRITVSSNGSYQCMTDKEIVQKFSISVIEVPPPKCRISPSVSIGVSGIRLEFICELNTSYRVNGYLQIVGDGLNSSAVSQVKRIRQSVTMAKLLNRQRPSCKVMIQESNKPLSCSFPSFIDVEIDFDVDEATFVCHTTHDIENPTFQWILRDREKGLIDIESRSWTRKDGRILLLKEVGEEDDNRIMECAVSSGDSSLDIDAIGFATIRMDQEKDDVADGVPVWLERAIVGSILGLLMLIIISLVCTISCCMCKMKPTLLAIQEMMNSLNKDGKTAQPVSPSTGAQIVSKGSLKTDGAGMTYPIPPQIRIADDQGVAKTSVDYNDDYIYMGGDIDYEDMGRM